MGEYTPFGPRDDSYKEYEKIKFLKDNIDKINEDDVDEYSVPLCKLFRWLKLCIEIRFEDIRIRKNQREKAIVDRAQAIEDEAARVKKR